MKEFEIKYKIAIAIAERQMTVKGINDATDTIYKILQEQLTIPVVMQSLPKRLSNAAYLNAREMRYEDFVKWWDEQV